MDGLKDFYLQHEFGRTEQFIDSYLHPDCKQDLLTQATSHLEARKLLMRYRLMHCNQGAKCPNSREYTGPVSALQYE